MKSYDHYVDPWWVLFGDYNRERESESLKPEYMIGQKKCRKCGELFVPETPMQQVCGLHAIKQCIVCGGAYFSKAPNSKMCSKECMKNHTVTKKEKLNEAIHD